MRSNRVVRRKAGPSAFVDRLSARRGTWLAVALHRHRPDVEAERSRRRVKLQELSIRRYIRRKDIAARRQTKLVLRSASTQFLTASPGREPAVYRRSDLRRLRVGTKDDRDRRATTPARNVDARDRSSSGSRTARSPTSTSQMWPALAFESLRVRRRRAGRLTQSSHFARRRRTAPACRVSMSPDRPKPSVSGVSSREKAPAYASSPVSDAENEP